MLSTLLGLGCVLRLPAACARDPASALGNFLHLDGTLRYYNFDRQYEAPDRQNQRAGAAGGLLRLTTAPFLAGFDLRVALYGAWSTRHLGAGEKQQELLLMGTAPVLTTVGEAYGQFHRDSLLLRGGRQIMNTPWMGPRDSRMIPQTFNGVWGQYTLVKSLQIVVARVFSFKSRDSSAFYPDNLYYPSHYLGHEMDGNKDVFPTNVSPASAPGTIAAAARYRHFGLHAELWYYDFFDFAQTEYLDGGYTFGTHGTHVRPFLDLQYMHQSGGDYLTRYAATLFGRGGEVDATLVGARGGVRLDGTSISLSYDDLRSHARSFGGGAIISPYGNYTAMYAQVMSANLLKYGPGSALKLAGIHWFLHHSFTLQLAALLLHTDYSGDSDALYFDGTYHFPGKLRGLQLRDRLAWSNGADINGGHALMYGKLMLQYKFSI